MRANVDRRQMVHLDALEASNDILNTLLTYIAYDGNQDPLSLCKLKKFVLSVN